MAAILRVHIGFLLCCLVVGSVNRRMAVLSIVREPTYVQIDHGTLHTFKDML